MLKLVADFNVILMMLVLRKYRVLRTYRMQKLWGSSTKISEGLGGDQAGVPERAVSEVMRVKPKMQWRPQEVRETKIEKCLRKASGSEQSQSQRDTKSVSGPT